MKKQDIQKWVKALRSGKYKQASESLQFGNRFCCLGVACKLFIPPEKLIMDEQASTTLFGGLPDQQKNAPQWLKDINDDFLFETRNTLSYLNDSEGLTFNEIADVLEAVYILKVLDV